MSGAGPLYIGRDDCKKASCPRKQEFPKGDSPYCIGHSLENWIAEEKQETEGKPDK